MDNNQEKLRAYILKLAIKMIENNQVDDKISELQTIYVDDFRHYYSKIFGTITLIKNDDTYDLQTLAENVGIIFNGITAKYDNKDIDTTFFLQSKKLYDHINLDIARINYTETLVRNITEQNRITNEELKKINDKAEKMQRDYVTILGIFAAVIIAFVSGLTFSTSVLENIDKVNIFHLTFVMILTAFFLLNLLNLLLDFLRKINKIPPDGEKSIITRINGILLVALAVDLFVWRFGTFVWNRFLEKLFCLLK